jgi:hypothetical protein
MPCPAQMLGARPAIGYRLCRGTIRRGGCPAQMLGYAFPINHISTVGAAYVECGGLPPLFAVPARRDVLQPVTMAAAPARQSSN